MSAVVEPARDARRRGGRRVVPAVRDHGIHDRPRGGQLRPAVRRAGARCHGAMERAPDAELAAARSRLATAAQVHGSDGARCTRDGWRRLAARRRRRRTLSVDRGTAMAVTVADCVPVFIAHPSGAVGRRSIRAGAARRRASSSAPSTRSPRAASRAAELRMHCGPAICGRCYEVSADVYDAAHRADPGAQPTTRRLRADHRRARARRAASARSRSARSARAATTTASTRTAPATPADNSA